MKELKLDLKYCHGINKLNYNFDLNNDYLIYAPNGTMKTSFSKTLMDYKNNIDSYDVYFPKRTSTRNITIENNDPLDINNLVIIDSDDYEIANEKMTSLLVNPSLKKEYDQVYSTLEKSYKDINKKIKSLSGMELQTVLFDLKISNLNDIQTDYLNPDNANESFKDIKYSKLFTDDNLKILEQKDIVESIDNYIKTCNDIIENNDIFVKDVFELYNLKAVIKNLDSNNYFKLGHLLKFKSIKDKEKFYDYDEKTINDLIANLDEQLSKDENIKKANEVLTGKIKSQELNTLLSKNQWIIPMINDLNKLKMEYWHYILSTSDIRITIEDYINNYIANREIINEIIKKTNDSDNYKKWNNAINEFNNKFINMPFELEVNNISDIILKNSACSLKYKFKDESGVNDNVDKNLLKENLSKGERKAFNILNLIFEIQYRKENNIETIFVLDDIADSFDYKNKYAIIELLKELNDNGLFHLIILTHNFDFYRACANRLKIKILSVLKDSEISLIDFYFKKNIFKSFKERIDDSKFFIASIPFVRNIIEMTIGNDDNDYLLLTSCLHYKKNTDSITVSQVNNVFTNHINTKSNIADTKYTDLLFDVADNIKIGTTEIELHNKLILSIAIRLLFEKKLFNKFNNWTILDGFTKNQTNELIDYCINNSLLVDEEKNISEKVKIMVSENIHVNAFMYEPIIDMSDEELINLYKIVKNM